MYSDKMLQFRRPSTSPDLLQEPLTTPCPHFGGLEPPLLYISSLQFAFRSSLNCQRCFHPFRQCDGREWEHVFISGWEWK